jgi:hypothetical protein
MSPVEFFAEEKPKPIKEKSYILSTLIYFYALSLDPEMLSSYAIVAKSFEEKEKIEQSVNEIKRMEIEHKKKF